jgi:hypothetical protein
LAARTIEQQLARDTGLITGFPKRLASVTLLVEGVEYTANSAVALFQTRVTAATNVVNAKVALKATVKTAEATLASTATAASGLVEAIYVAFGDDPAALADFNLPPRKKPAPLSPAERLEASAKAKATREARGTKGAKQKAAITGTVPAAAPAAVAPAAAPVAPTTGK